MNDPRFESHQGPMDPREAYTSDSRSTNPSARYCHSAHFLEPTKILTASLLATLRKKLSILTSFIVPTLLAYLCFISRSIPCRCVPHRTKDRQLSHRQHFKELIIHSVSVTFALSTFVAPAEPSSLSFINFHRPPSPTPIVTAALKLALWRATQPSLNQLAISHLHRDRTSAFTNAYRQAPSGRRVTVNVRAYDSSAAHSIYS